MSKRLGQAAGQACDGHAVQTAVLDVLHICENQLWGCQQKTGSCRCVCAMAAMSDHAFET